MKKLITTAVLSGLMSAVAFIPAYAQIPTGAKNGIKTHTASTTMSALRGATIAANQAKRITAMQTRAATEIDARTTSLNNLISRLQAMKNVSDAQKSSIVTMIQNLINELATLKTQISTDTSTTSLKTDTQSITQAYRIYALVQPQLSIIAASDRIVTIVAMMNQLGSKIQTRLSIASGLTNLVALQADMSDFTAKVIDANTQAQAAVSEVSSLVPDQGDKTILASNTSALKDARSKVKTATTDLTTARKDAQTVIQALVKQDKNMLKTSSSTPPVVTTSTTTQ